MIRATLNHDSLNDLQQISGSMYSSQSQVMAYDPLMPFGHLLDCLNRTLQLDNDSFHQLNPPNARSFKKEKKLIFCLAFPLVEAQT
ncbi:hypothetical protein TNCV_2238761 [Trichonephila clavipes]|nr:hypothetical protein TNCV_2238761 [Trichonephila clavipes]